MVQASGFSKLDEVVARLWSEVIRTINNILEADKRFGFGKFEQYINPSLEDILHGLGIIESVLTAFAESDFLGPDQVRQSLNAKQCVLHIRRLNNSLKHGNLDDYNEVIRLLDAQAKI